MENVGLTDIHGRKIVYEHSMSTRAASSHLIILMLPNGDFHLMKLNRILPVVAHNEQNFVFQGFNFGGFGFKGGGKKYGFRSHNSSRPYFQVDYHGADLYITQNHRLTSSIRKFGPEKFISGFWIFILKRQQKKQRKLFKSNLLKESKLLLKGIK